MYKNREGYPDPTPGKAIRRADKPPEEVVNFRRAMKLMCVICHVRVLGKITVVDESGSNHILGKDNRRSHSFCVDIFYRNLQSDTGESGAI